jgi:NADH-quinone oxidoreductase subunit J
MTLYSVIFYILAVVMIISTVLAITRRYLVHSVVYLIVSFLATGLLFYLLGAPFLAALEVIIYAGAIMVLFLFIVMTLVVEERGKKGLESFRQWIPAIVLSVISLFVVGVLLFEVPGSRETLAAGMATPAAFGQFIFKNYWFPVEIASFLLLIGLVGTLYLGRRTPKEAGDQTEDET